jgi:hypothetical protein
MSTMPSSLLDTRAAPQRTRWPAWMREPLLHFVVLGVALFGIDHAVSGRSGDPRVLVVDRQVDAQARAIFEKARGRAPDVDELYALRRVWLDNEVLYREGLALQVDKGDTAIRERVIFKALSLVDAGLKLPATDEAQLRQWFERHRANYDEPARYDFQEAVLAGDNAEAPIRAFVQALNNQSAGEARAGLRVFKARPLGNIVDSYGADFAKALDEMPAGEWRALATREGWRAIRLEQITPPKPAQFDVLRGMARQDWIDATMADLRTAQVRAMAAKYRISVEGEAR